MKHTFEVINELSSVRATKQNTTACVYDILYDYVMEVCLFKTRTQTESNIWQHILQTYWRHSDACYQVTFFNRFYSNYE